MFLQKKSMEFEEKFSRSILAGKVQWEYYKLGSGGNVILFLTGGLRRARLGYEFLEELAGDYTVIAADYPPSETIEEFIAGIEAVLKFEGVEKVNIIGQSYGGIIAQAFSLFTPELVRTLIISNSGPLLYNLISIVELKIILKLLDVLSEEKVKRLFWSMISKVFSENDDKTEEMRAAAKEIIMKELTKGDIYSHFSVALSIFKGIRKKSYIKNIPVYVLRSEDDITQSDKDIAKYHTAYGQSVKIISLGNAGHAAMVTDMAAYCNAIRKMINEE